VRTPRHAGDGPTLRRGTVCFTTRYLPELGQHNSRTCLDDSQRQRYRNPRIRLTGPCQGKRSGTHPDAHAAGNRDAKRRASSSAGDFTARSRQTMVAQPRRRLASPLRQAFTACRGASITSRPPATWQKRSQNSRLSGGNGGGGNALPAREAFFASGQSLMNYCDFKIESEPEGNARAVRRRDWIVAVCYAPLNFPFLLSFGSLGSSARSDSGNSISAGISQRRAHPLRRCRLGDRTDRQVRPNHFPGEWTKSRRQIYYAGGPIDGNRYLDRRLCCRSSASAVSPGRPRCGGEAFGSWASRRDSGGVRWCSAQRWPD
jgi:hypothetical protein